MKLCDLIRDLTLWYVEHAVRPRTAKFGRENPDVFVAEPEIADTLALTMLQAIKELEG